MKFTKQLTMRDSRNICITDGTLTVENTASSLTTEEYFKIHDDYLQFFYKNSASKIPLDEVYTRQIIHRARLSKDVIGIIRDGGVLVGGVIAATTKHALSEDVILQHTLYYSDLKGLRAVRAMRLAFKYLIEVAKQRGIKYVFAACGSWDTSFKLNRILSLDGWQSEGYLSVYKLEGEDKCHSYQL